MSKAKPATKAAEANTGRKSFWIIRLLGLFLLVVQTVGLIVGGAYYLRKKEEERKSNTSQSQNTNSQTQNKNDNSKSDDIDDVLKNDLEVARVGAENEISRYKGLFNPIGVLIALSAILFFFRFRGGWLLALLIEGVVLYVCLSLYFGNQFIPLIYPIMLYGIFMVLFLNSGAVRKVFLPRMGKQ